MKKLLSVVLLCLMSCTPALGKLAARVNVSSVSSGGDVNELGSGSGFAVVDDDGEIHILTAGHVCIMALRDSVLNDTEPMITLTIGSDDGTADTGLFAIKRISPVNDLCELKVLIPTVSPLQPLELAGSDPKVGDKVIIVGAPYGIYPVRSDGYYIGRSRYDKNSYLGAQGNAGPGNSGSPVFDEDWQVVGMLVLGARDWLSFSVPHEEISDFINQ